ncbi:hypothetical protein [Pseudomonas granadensis]|uniref:hypothetical protein n=1 Tax=Pseudomonas granadensis TaxID=1421430 RepID=UPI00087D93B9|nr:hypothetical protein [Pseudomonas granadensis]SDT20048.1 hypothetical protein SAMN05216579_2802 [Pseudomonas granadensis]
MKRQALLSIAFSLFALNAFAATPAQPLVAEGGSDRLLEQRTAAVTQTDPLFSDAVAATETDPLFSDAVAATETDPLFSDAVAATETDPLFSDAVAEGGSDRLIERRAV